ncbi:hypothetical protein ElyMa_003940300 [Elysia marginata]|uniref:Uncharacterized protein n=1 Tax=Elysia marginata TaxID=1093978 RepID=A0AAV4FU00_9GAST|nr:hypothetical protein ElyMa_003940300 [Elysia marginata]
MPKTDKQSSSPIDPKPQDKKQNAFVPSKFKAQLALKTQEMVTLRVIGRTALLLGVSACVLSILGTLVINLLFSSEFVVVVVVKVVVVVVVVAVVVVVVIVVVKATSALQF